MQLGVVTCGVFPSEEIMRSKLWIFLASCKKFGIEPMIYGVGRTFPAYRMMMLDWQLEFLKTIPTEYTHILFTDGWDAFFTAPKATIIRKYQDMGSPDVLVSAFYQLANVSNAEERYPDLFDTSKRYSYPNRGGYFAKREAIIDAFERMVAQDEQTGDDCFNWYRLILDGWRPTLDSNCEIFLS